LNTAVVTQEGQQFTAVFYVLVDGKTMVKIDSKNVVVAPGQFNLFTVSWGLGGKALPPSDFEAVTKDANTSNPSGFPYKVGYFDSGAQWVLLALQASGIGSVNDIFVTPTTKFSSGSIPAFKAKPTIGRILGEFSSGSGNGSLLPALRVLSSSGVVKLSVDDLVAFRGEIIPTTAGTFAITTHRSEVRRRNDTWPGCARRARSSKGKRL